MMIASMYIMCYTFLVTRRTLAAFRIESEILEGLQAIKERDGVPASEQVRRALRQWLKSRRYKLKEQKGAKKR